MQGPWGKIINYKVITIFFLTDKSYHRIADKPLVLKALNLCRFDFFMLESPFNVTLLLKLKLRTITKYCHQKVTQSEV